MSICLLLKLTHDLVHSCTCVANCTGFNAAGKRHSARVLTHIVLHRACEVKVKTISNQESISTAFTCYMHGAWASPENVPARGVIFCKNS